MKKISVFISILLLAASIQAQEPATYDGSTLDIPLVEVNSQYFSDVKVTLNGDGTWELQGIGGSESELFDPDSEPPLAPKLEVLTRDPDSNFDFQVIARVTEVTGDKSCTSLIALPQQIDGNIITVAVVSILKIIVSANEACTLSLAQRSIDIKLDTEDLSPGTYIVKYRGKSGEFILP